MKIKGERFFVLVIVLVLTVLGSVFADSFTLSTAINGVSGGPDGFGWGLFPLGTSFEYNTSFPLSETLPYEASLEIESSFSISEVTLDDTVNYDWKTGEPWWHNGNLENKITGKYFRPVATMYFELTQGFGVNPVQGSGEMFNVALGFYTRYAIARERLNLGSGTPFFSAPVFTSGDDIPAYPWLYGSRNLWNNHMVLSSSWYFRKRTAPADNYDGLTFSLSLEWGPSWLGNSVFPDTVTSDYFKASGSATEYLTIFTITQDNGWNWLTLMLSHSNSAGYTWGDVIPEHKIQTDRLRGYLTDTIALRLTGPQFLAGDCYPYFEVKLNNNFYFGGVQNDITKSIRGWEFRSSVSGEVHLRLFGFIHVNYTFGYNFIKGFESASPNWWQSAQLGFYVSL